MHDYENFHQRLSDLLRDTSEGNLPAQIHHQDRLSHPSHRPDKGLRVGISGGPYGIFVIKQKERRCNIYGSLTLLFLT
jgi:hypothetical protein